MINIHGESDFAKRIGNLLSYWIYSNGDMSQADRINSENTPSSVEPLTQVVLLADMLTQQEANTEPSLLWQYQLWSKAELKPLFSTREALQAAFLDALKAYKVRTDIKSDLEKLALHIQRLQKKSDYEWMYADGQLKVFSEILLCIEAFRANTPQYGLQKECDTELSALKNRFAERAGALA